MKITDVRSVPVFYGSRNYMFVVVETNEGLNGIGEFGVSWREQAGIGAVEHLKSRLIGENPLNIERLWQIMFRGDFFPGGRISMAAQSAIDIALWDIKGKTLGQPIYMLLGGQLRDRVPCYAHIQDSTQEKMVENALKRVEEGWRYVRVHVPDRDGVLDASAAVRDTLALAAAVRDAVGREIEICIDAHTRLDVPDAVRLGRELEPLAPFFLEDPLRSENPQSYRHLRAHVSCPLAVGEHYGSKWEFRQMLEEDLLDYARIDLCLAGGLTEARKIAGWCETHYIKIVPHNPLGPVSAAACLHLDLATDNFAVQEGANVGSGFMNDVFPVQVPFESGCMLPPQQPGLGIEFDEGAAASYPFEWSKGPLFRRSDGSFTNW